MKAGSIDGLVGRSFGRCLRVHRFTVHCKLVGVGNLQYSNYYDSSSDINMKYAILKTDAAEILIVFFFSRTNKTSM
jgi:hypothetical protein